MSYLYIDLQDTESQNLLKEFAFKRLNKKVAVSFNSKHLNGGNTTTEPVNLEISNVLGNDVYFKVSISEIASLDDQEY